MHGFDKPAHDVMVTVAATMKTRLPTKKRGVAYASNGFVVVTRLSDDDKDGDLHAVLTKILLLCKKTAAENTNLAAEIAAENTINATMIPRNVCRSRCNPHNVHRRRGDGRQEDVVRTPPDRALKRNVWHPLRPQVLGGGRGDH